jgi:hypothetical protein
MTRLGNVPMSSEEYLSKALTSAMKHGMMRLGAQPSKEAATPNPFPYVLHWNIDGRKGQRCRLKTFTHNLTRRPTVEIEFEDGTARIVNRSAIRRI